MIRHYLSTRTRLLLFSGVCFAGLTATNALLFIDLVVLPTEVDLAPLRALLTLAALSILVFGMIWHAR